jgi:hypothetical protein
MTNIHSQMFVRNALLRVEERLPTEFEAAGLALEISSVSRSARWVGDLRSIQHAATWTDGNRSGAAVIDLLRMGSALTELCVRLDGLDGSLLGREGRLDRRRRQLQDHVMALRRVLDHDRTANTAVVASERPPWVGRTSA